MGEVFFFLSGEGGDEGKKKRITTTCLCVGAQNWCWEKFKDGN